MTELPLWIVSTNSSVRQKTAAWSAVFFCPCFFAQVFFCRGFIALHCYLKGFFARHCYLKNCHSCYCDTATETFGLSAPEPATHALSQNMASIFLIGPMGAGKTTVGRQLARRLSRTFYDSDREIEAACGVDIPTIFDFEGEAGFRCREQRMIDLLTSKPDIVLATGGGAVLREENRQRLKSRGVVVFLDVDIDVQVERTSRNNNRPLLQQGNARATLLEISKQRRPIYTTLAHVSISTSNQRHQRVVDKICRQIKKFNAEQTALERKN